MSSPQPLRVAIDGSEDPGLVPDEICVNCTQSISVESDQRDNVLKQWFATGPLDAVAIGRLRAVQLHTISHDQGKVDAPEREGTTWFEISVQKPSPGIETVWLPRTDSSTGQNCRWLSHVNPTGRETPQNMSGAVFYPPHELWSFLQPGDRIAVTAGARFAGSINTGLSAKLVFWRFQFSALPSRNPVETQPNATVASQFASSQSLVPGIGGQISLPSAQYFPFAFRVEPELFLTWHELARTLTRGTAERPALPAELVLSVFTFAGCLVPDALRFETYTIINSYCDSFDPARKLWMATEPLDAATLSRITGLQLHTIGHDQGWADEIDLGPRTWFEISIQRLNPGSSEWKHVHRVPKRESEYGWISHYNVVAQRRSHALSGLFFGPDHEIWTELHPGDRLVVNACAREPAWSCTGMSARLDFWRRFEPSYM